MCDILVIDDEPYVRAMLENILKKEGYVVCSASDGEEALKILAQENSLVILLDLKMPVMGGLEFLENWQPSRELLQSVIVLTGHGGQEEMEKCYRLGVQAFLQKPVNIIELKAIVHRTWLLMKYFGELQQLNHELEAQVQARTQALSNELQEHKRLNAKLRQLSRAVEQSASMIVITNIQGAIEYVNPKLLEVTGYAWEEIKGENPRILKSGELSAENYHELWQTLQRGETWSGELHNKKKNGELYWVFQTISPLRDETGQMTHFVAVGEDITARKAAEEELQQAHTELQITYSELERINGTFQRFVPKQFIHRIMSRGVDFLQPGYVEEETLTILFSDIRGYTSLTEHMTSHETFELLNTYLQMMEPCITSAQGFIDKFIGDGIMALFDGEHSAERAIEAAIQMQRALLELNEKRQAQGLTPLQVGMGINTGQVMVGTLGSAERLESTVVGDQVNLTARLEELTKIYRARILISEHTFAALTSRNVLMREIDTVQVRGKSQAVGIYEVYHVDPEELRHKKQLTQPWLEHALACRRAKDLAGTMTWLLRCCELCPEDSVVQHLMLRTTEAMIQHSKGGSA